MTGRVRAVLFADGVDGSAPVADSHFIRAPLNSAAANRRFPEVPMNTQRPNSGLGNHNRRGRKARGECQWRKDVW